MDNATINTKQRDNSGVTISKLTPHEGDATQIEIRHRKRRGTGRSVGRFHRSRQRSINRLRFRQNEFVRKFIRMKLVLGLVVFALAISPAPGQSIEIVSPNHADTFAYGDAFSHQIERDRLTNEMIARVMFSNYPYAGDRELRRDEMFDFVFPGLHFDAAQNEFFARTSHRGMRIPIAVLHTNFPYAGYQLEPTTKIFLVKHSGRVTAVLNATAQPRNGARWVQIDDNWSLQHLLALGLERLTR
jgi:hypothetical protein